ncbi:MAG: hypothetical protein PHV27_06485, partial [Mesotoga sp.]|uniref:hypothetical protein n=1 Tax=Mesotoga sp. TaxID=2053577 RepID=UPI00260C372F
PKIIGEQLRSDAGKNIPGSEARRNIRGSDAASQEACQVRRQRFSDQNEKPDLRFMKNEIPCRPITG